MEKKFDDRTLYAIKDRRTDTVIVRPGGLLIGRADREAVDIQAATRQQAEQGWQRPLSAGYTVKEDEPCSL